MEKDNRFVLVAESYIAKVLEKGDIAVCVHIYVNGFLHFGILYGTGRKKELAKYITSYIKDTFKDVLVKRLSDDRFIMMAHDDEMELAFAVLNQRIKKDFRDSGVIVSAGGCRIRSKEDRSQIIEAMKLAEEVCHDIVLHDEIHYRVDG